MVVGRLGRPHGLRGHLKAQATGPTLRGLELPARVTLDGPSGTRSSVLLEVSGDARRLLLLLEESGDREQAAALTGHDVLVPRADLPVLAGPDEFYVADLVGFLIEVDGEHVGTLNDVLERPANDVLEVRSEAGETVLVPFVAAAIVDVDHPGRRIRLHGWAWEAPA